FGAEVNTVGEVVFNTAMMGYPESLTDPSYAGQILVTTFPLIGNYGVPSLTPNPSPKERGVNSSTAENSAENANSKSDHSPLLGRGVGGEALPVLESDKIHVKGLVVADYSQEYSHWNAKESLSSWLKREGIPAISGIDTRRLTKLLREHGVMRGRISLTPDPSPKGEGSDNLDEDYGSINWVEKVSCKEVITYKPDNSPLGACDASLREELSTLNSQLKTVVLVDCGVKANIIRCLLRRGVEVLRVPWDYDFNQLEFDGLFLANGPGDPEQCEVTVRHIRTFLETELKKVTTPLSNQRGAGGEAVRPCMGICLGNQLLARAAGAKTYKLKYGHRSHNQPVRQIGTNRCFITSQNHGYAVDAATLPADWEPLFVNMNDGSNEGIRHKTNPWFSAQFHPEACSGPTDTEWMFDEFIGRLNAAPLSSPEGDTKPLFSANKGKEAPSGAVGGALSSLALRGGVGGGASSVLLLGSGALKIGQAGEFDYSGAQALKALKEEGIRSILINPNIATVQTSKDVADTVYFQPVTPEFVERVIEKERPDGILLSFGGQTALNCGVELYKKGVLEKYGVKVLGTPVQAIIDTEDRDLFVKRLDEIGVKTIKSEACSTIEEVQQAAHELGFPVILRAAYALGGLGSGFCDNDEELLSQAEEAFSFSPQVLVEKSLKGWKEIEYEVVRDCFDNCITVCNMENLDPLGIHTGESIVVAPSQTLTNSEYHKLRALAIKIIRHIGIVGECNVQYALDPESEDYRVIEVNARLSRSSALASKATGYPLAFVAAKLGLGYGLFDLKNSVTKTTSAFFEPALDYVVCKIPRWDLSKFHGVNHELGSSMKSVGEVMAIGRTFEEAIQKGLRMIGQGMHGFVDNKAQHVTDIPNALQHATDTRIFVIAKAMLIGYSVEQIHKLTKIDRWFLQKLHHIVGLNAQLKEFSQIAALAEVMDSLELMEYLETPEFVELLREAKIYGFSDFQIARALGLGENRSMEEAGLLVRKWRKELGVIPTVSQIDTLAAEYPAQTNYLYLSYL
ncbi:MAG: carbamoyl-phosphate synthase large subunit, partial [Bacteroidaceae bacterium]|nr:carbamoyl-phosphate synthase large subunit [Bacteroidaceae bacterium]